MQNDAAKERRADKYNRQKGIDGSGLETEKNYPEPKVSAVRKGA